MEFTRQEQDDLNEALVELHGPDLSEFLIEACRDHFVLTHEKCGETLLTTMHVHLHTLDRIIHTHKCGLG